MSINPNVINIDLTVHYKVFISYNLSKVFLICSTALLVPMCKFTYWQKIVERTISNVLPEKYYPEKTGAHFAFLVEAYSRADNHTYEKGLWRRVSKTPLGHYTCIHLLINYIFEVIYTHNFTLKETCDITCLNQ